VTETTDALPGPLPQAATEQPAERADLGERAFVLGVAASTAAVAAFLSARLLAWPPHEDETLALFVSRDSLGGLLHTVLGERGGAPLHFLLSWIVAHTGGGLTGLRIVSAVFAVASVPLIAALGARLAGRSVALTTTVLASASWMLLFHGVYARMYSLFLFTSALSFLALLRALEKGGKAAWALWVLSVLLVVASHPYGALVLASQGVYVLLVRERLREALPAFAAVGVLGIPFWRTDLVLAGRFDVGVGGGGEKLGSPWSVLLYLKDVAGDFTAGYAGVVAIVLLLALAGLLTLGRERPRGALLAACAIGTPAAAFLLARLGHSTAPESRHLIFTLPFFALLLAAGVLRTARLIPVRGAGVVLAAVLCLVVAEVAWGQHRTADLYRGEPGPRIAARHAASAWLVATTRPDDVLFGYDPLYLEAWERGGTIAHSVVPRADARLALRRLENAAKPLGRGVWVFDASDTSNAERALTIPLRYPQPKSAYEARRFGPFLVVRSTRPTGTIRRYLKQARNAEVLGESLDIGDAGVNLGTILSAARTYERERTDSSRSTVSR
jgi:hypothetical protein